MKDVAECKSHYTFNAMKGTLLNGVVRDFDEALHGAIPTCTP